MAPMTTMSKVVPAVAAVAVIVAAIAIYPSARGAYIRNRANAHLEDARAMRDTLKSPVGARALDDAMGTMRLTLRGNGADTGTIAKADRALVDVMTRLKETPPPDQAVIVTAKYDASAQAGAAFPVAITIAPMVDEIFVDTVTVEIGADRGWRTDPVRSSLRQAVSRSQPLSTRVDVPIPPAASGMGAVRVTLVYRLNPTGEGQDLEERPAGLSAVSIVR
jgi:hypothetical protein